MTIVAQTLFICNRCQEERAVPTANIPPIQRISTEGWLTLFVNNTDTAQHLCPGCAKGFNHFMEEIKNADV